MLFFQSLVFVACMTGTSLALPQPGQPAAPAPTLGTINYNIPGILNNTLTPILGKGSDGGLEVGGIGSHDTKGGEVHEHGNGDAQVGPKGVEVCLTQTFVVKPISIPYGVAVGSPGPCQTPAKGQEEAP